MIGFIGLGRMGGAMAAHLVAAGHRVLGLDPSPGARDAARESGVEIVGSVSELRVPVVMSSLPGDAEVEAVYSDDLFRSLEPGALCLDLSTVDVGPLTADRRRSSRRRPPVPRLPGERNVGARSGRDAGGDGWWRGRGQWRRHVHIWMPSAPPFTTSGQTARVSR